MKILLTTDVFDKWLLKLRDKRACAKIKARMDRLELGHTGDAEAVGEGVSELRIHYGPGYRVYFIENNFEIIVLLCGGDKSSQRKDIEKAKLLAKEL